MPPTVLITRPEPAALHLADRLRLHWGCVVSVVISPLMRIAYADEPIDLERVEALIFTSAQGVAAFARLSGRRDLRCYAVGSATAAAAKAEGFDAIAAGGDATALCARIIADKPRGTCLHLRGAHAAGDVGGTLRKVGIVARDQVVYRQEEMPLTAQARALLVGKDPVLLPLYSPRSAVLFFKQIRPSAPMFIAAISRNAAEPVPQEFLQRLVVSDHPDGDAMLRALNALRESAIQLESTWRAQ